MEDREYACVKKSEFGNSFFHLSLTTPMTTENSNAGFRLVICCGRSPSISSLNS